MSSTASPFFVEAPSSPAEAQFPETPTAALLRITCGLTEEQIEELTRRGEASQSASDRRVHNARHTWENAVWYVLAIAALAVATQVLSVG